MATRVPGDEERFGVVRAPAGQVATPAKAGAPAWVEGAAAAHVIHRAERAAQAAVHRVERVPRGLVEPRARPLHIESRRLS